MSWTLAPRHISASATGASVSLQSADTTLHTSIAGSDSFDDVVLHVTNNTGASETLTIKVGASVVVVATVPANAGHVLAAQLRVNGAAAVTGACTTNDALKVTGKVTRWSP